MYRLFLLCFIVLANVSYGQDAVFSQYYHNPVSTSSALTGAFNGKYRVGSNIRRQWFGIDPRISFNTTNVFGDLRINSLGDDYFSIGLILEDDNSGSAKIGRSHGYLSLSYSKHLSSNKYSGLNQYLLYGVQFGYGKIYFGSEHYLFGFQFDKNIGQVDINKPNGEEVINSRLYLDINSGLMWYLTSKKGSFYLGAEVKHLNRPNISLLANSENKLYMRYSGILGGEIFLAKGFSLLPSMLINFQGPTIQTILGSNIRYEYHKIDNNAFRFGGWIRLVNSLDGLNIADFIASTIVEFNNVELGISYDINVSQINRITNFRGAFEISIIYIWGESPMRHPINCPRF